MKNSENQQVSEIMSKDLYTVQVTDSLETAEQLFNTKHIRHLPVVAEEKLVGMLSWTDIKRLEFGDTYGTDDFDIDDEMLHLLTIDQVMKSHPTVIQTSQSITTAAQELIKAEFHALPVINLEDKLVGIVTTTDVIQYLLDK